MLRPQQRAQILEPEIAGDRLWHRPPVTASRAIFACSRPASPHIAERVAGLYLLKGKPVFLWNLLDLKRDGVRGKVFSKDDARG
jgi:hypothetical protein